jgi:hypothetical protein
MTGSARPGRPIVIALAAASALALMSPGVDARSLVGVYEGRISCGRLTDVKRVWTSPFRMTVEDGAARYERPILRDGHGTGVYERGSGTVAANGRVGLAGRADGATYLFDAQYQGELAGDAATLVGTQLWYIRGRDTRSERSCRIDLTRVSPTPS